MAIKQYGKYILKCKKGNNYKKHQTSSHLNANTKRLT